jgi:hypothetical protein
MIVSTEINYLSLVQCGRFFFFALAFRLANFVSIVPTTAPFLWLCLGGLDVNLPRQANEQNF